MKMMVAILLVAVIFLSGALAGKYTGMVITSPAGDLSANTLTVTNINSATGIVNVASNLKGTKTIMGVASAGDIGVSGSSPSGRGIFGRSETGYGIEGYANTATGYSGYFHGGKGLYTDKIVFGTTTFSSANGRLMLAAETGQQCGSVCSTHGLGCIKTLAIEGTATAQTLRDVGGCTYGTGLKFCMCG